MVWDRNLGFDAEQALRFITIQIERNGMQYRAVGLLSDGRELEAIGKSPKDAQRRLTMAFSSGEVWGSCI